LSLSLKKKDTGFLQLFVLSAAGFFTVSSVSLLHVNQYEFIVLRFPNLSMLSVSLFDSVLYAAYLINGFLTGVISNRSGRRKIFAMTGSGGSILFFYLMTRIERYPLLLLFRFFQGAFSVMVWQTLMTLVIDNATDGNRGTYMGVFGSFLALSMGMGPAVGGYLARMGLFTPYYAAMIGNGVVLLLVFLSINEPAQVKGTPTVRETLRVIRKRSELSVPALFNFVDRLHIGFIIFILPMYIQYVLGLGPETRGVILGVHALPFILLQYPAGRLSDMHGRYFFLIGGSFGYGLLLMFSGYIGEIGLSSLAASFFVLGIFSGITAPTNAALVGDMALRDEHAMAVGFFHLAGNMGIALGPLVAGFVIDLSRFQVAFVFAGLIEILSLGICVLLMYRFHLFRG